MPRGVPTIGSHYEPQSTELSGSVMDELTNAPQPEVLGTIPMTPTKELPPPPWEADPSAKRHNTDARKFVRVPDDWELRWVNPRILEREGWRYWKKVDAKGDTRVKVLNQSMVAPDNTIRKGGHDGSILAWMYRHWVESRNQQKAERVRRLSGEAVARSEQVKEEVRRRAGRYVSVDSVQHPTHTIGDGKTFEKD